MMRALARRLDLSTLFNGARGGCAVIGPDRLGAMSRLFSYHALLLALFLPLLASGAEAGVGDRAGEANRAWKGSPIEKVQYFSFDDQDYCWYDDGWNGPGWYWCGYELDQGAGWGGAYGWNGWGGGHTIHHHGRRGAGVWHPGPPARRLGARGVPTAPRLPAGGAPTTRHFRAGGALSRPGVNGGVAAYPGLHGGGAPFHGAEGGGGLHGFGGAPASPGFQGGGAPVSHGFGGGGFQGFGGGGFHGGGGFQGGGAPASHGFGGGGGFQGIGGGGFHGGGGFQGGGGAFSGGHGGGHR